MRATRQLVATPSGVVLPISKDSPGEIDIWVLGFGVSRIALIDTRGNAITSEVPYQDVSHQLDYAALERYPYPTRQVVVGRGERLRLTVFGEGCAWVLMAGG